MFMAIDPSEGQAPAPKPELQYSPGEAVDIIVTKLFKLDQMHEQMDSQYQGFPKFLNKIGNGLMHTGIKIAGAVGKPLVRALPDSVCKKILNACGIHGHISSAKIQCVKDFVSDPANLSLLAKHIDTIKENWAIPPELAEAINATDENGKAKYPGLAELLNLAIAGGKEFTERKDMTAGPPGEIPTYGRSFSPVSLSSGAGPSAKSVASIQGDLLKELAKVVDDAGAKMGTSEDNTPKV
jgi:hypothetical protein